MADKVFGKRKLKGDCKIIDTECGEREIVTR